MLEVILLILLALGLGGLMESIGVLRTIRNTLAKWATNSGKLTTSTMLSALFGKFFGGAAYVSIITDNKITEKTTKSKVLRNVFYQEILRLEELLRLRWSPGLLVAYLGGYIRSSYFSIFTIFMVSLSSNHN
ncbi:Na+/H+ antiporter NhaC family protein [Marinococcus halophilus]|uniref:Na+/H+ antiporter NhaC-like C-terminal domain-containing protein n=1 Tax=Marinococcus halophilus TaxID=1371 RepID=A0A510Y992_MARHA|nr:Na+/H+ antiporter NhaC family protein [Marinococcus halophilus]GEK59942.1 hypothetical protein MHA01_28470 [Marinococcus halophilus]